MSKSLLYLLLLTPLVVACSGKSSESVQSLQKRDKQLSCKEILLEMNEAEFYRNAAQQNKAPNLKNVLMPLGYISTYMSADEAIGASNARVEYLDRVYQIMQCDGNKSQAQLVPEAQPQSDYAGGQGVMGGAAPMPTGGRYYPAPGQVQYRHDEPPANEQDGYAGFYPIGMYW